MVSLAIYEQDIDGAHAQRFTDLSELSPSNERCRVRPSATLYDLVLDRHPGQSS